MLEIKNKQPVIGYGYDVTSNPSLLAELCDVFGITSTDVVKIGEDGYGAALLTINFGDIVEIDETKISGNYSAITVLLNGASPSNTDYLTMVAHNGGTKKYSLPRTIVQNITYSML